MQSKKAGECQKEADTRVVKIAVQDSVQVNLLQNWKKTRKQMGKRYLSKKSFTYEIYAGTSKAAHKVFQQRGASSIREFPFFITCSFLHGNYG